MAAVVSLQRHHLAIDRKHRIDVQFLPIERSEPAASLGEGRDRKQHTYYIYKESSHSIFPNLKSSNII